LEFADHANHAFPFSFLGHGKIIIIQFCIRICLMCKLKGQFNKSFSNDLIELALPPVPIIQYGLIDYIPALYPALVPRYYGLYMLAHPCRQDCPRSLFAILANKEPIWSLRMPDQGVSNKLHSVFLTQFHKSVCTLKIKFPLLGPKVHRLQTV